MQKLLLESDVACDRGHYGSAVTLLFDGKESLIYSCSVCRISFPRPKPDPIHLVSTHEVDAMRKLKRLGEIIFERGTAREGARIKFENIAMHLDHRPGYSTQ